MQSDNFTWKVKLFLVLFGVGLSLIALEIFTRLYFKRAQGTEFADLKELRAAMLKDGGGNIRGDAQGSGEPSANLRGLVVPHPDDDIIYDLIPGLEIRFQRADVRINSYGMRGPERPVYKGADTFRIALLGDSFAFGWGVEQEETFAQILENTLNRISRGNPNFEVLNFGIPGYSTFQEVAKFKEIGLDFNPDAVLVFFIDNDFGFPFYVRDVYNPGSIMSAVSFARLTWSDAEPEIEEQKEQLTSYDPNRAIRKLHEICKEVGIPLYFTINPRKDWRRHYRKLWILKERPDIRFINMRPELLKAIEDFNIEEKDLTLSFDPHPSPLRHNLYGNLLAQHFMEYIQ